MYLCATLTLYSMSVAKHYGGPKFKGLTWTRMLDR